jgi:hypothetical protein
MLIHCVLRDATADDPTMDVASRCLAFAGNIYTTLWGEFMESGDFLEIVLTFTLKCVERVSYWVFQNRDTKNNRVVSQRYLGFDERDKKDYNMEGYDDEKEADNIRANELANREETIMTWLLILSQIYSQPLPKVTSKVEEKRAVRSASCKEKEDETEAEAATTQSMHVIEVLKDTLSALLHMTKNMSEASYLLVIKVATAVNLQFPLQLETNTTEVRIITVMTVFNRIILDIYRTLSMCS